jgi:hypothetical protein
VIQKEFCNTIGTKLPTRDVRSSVAIGVKPDMTWTAQFGRDWVNDYHRSVAPVPEPHVSLPLI